MADNATELICKSIVKMVIMFWMPKVNSSLGHGCNNNVFLWLIYRHRGVLQALNILFTKIYSKSDCLYRFDLSSNDLRDGKPDCTAARLAANRHTNPDASALPDCPE